MGTQFQLISLFCLEAAPYFLPCSRGPLAETNNKIEIVDCDRKDDFEELLKFVYTDDCNITWENVFSLLYLSKKYLIPALSRKCCRYLAKNLDKDSI